MRILLTGGAGFIGSHIADSLIAHGYDVRVLDAFLPVAHNTSIRPAYLADCELISGDVRDAEVLKTALRGVDIVCHQAAMVGLETSVADMPAYVEHNDFGTAQLLAAMAERDIRRLVFASSMVVYGEGRYLCPDHGAVRPTQRSVDDLDNGVFDPRCPQCTNVVSSGKVREDARPDPRNAYAATKLAQENLAAAWARHTGCSAVGLRYHNVYGPRMPRDTPYAGVASIFRSALAGGEAPQVFEDGGQRRDFVHVRDVAEANVMAIERAEPGFSAYNVCSGYPHTIGEMAEILAATSGGPKPVTSGRYRLGDVRHIVADSAKAKNDLGFRAKVGFAEGMAEFATAALRA